MLPFIPPEKHQKAREGGYKMEIFPRNGFQFNAINKKEETHEKLHQQINNLSIIKSVRFGKELCLVSSDSLVCCPTC